MVWACAFDDKRRVTPGAGFERRPRRCGRCGDDELNVAERGKEAREDPMRLTFPTIGGRGTRRAQCLPEGAAMANKRYTNEFKDEACDLVAKQGYAQRQAAEQLGINQLTL